jgi:hypothetical protein
MRKFYWVSFLFLAFFLGSVDVVSQVSDTLEYASKAGVADVADSDPGLFIVMMCMLLGALGICFLIFILTGLAVLGGILLVASGIVSVAFWIGLYNRSYSDALKWFLILVFGVMGIVGGCLFAFLLHMIWLEKEPLSEVMGWGTFIGGASGSLSGWGIFKAIRYVFDFVKRRYLLS